MTFNSSDSTAAVMDDFESYEIGTSPSSDLFGKSATVQTGLDFFIRTSTGDIPSEISASQGSKFAYLTTGPDDYTHSEYSNGSGPSPYDLDGDGNVENDYAEMSYNFYGDIGASLTFDFDVLTNEHTVEGYYDIFAVRLDGIFIVSGIISTDNTYSGGFPLVLDSSFSGMPADSNLGGPDGSWFHDGRLGWSEVITALTFSGTHELMFYVGDSGDHRVSTALLVDNIRLDSTTVPEPATMLLFGVGLLGIAGISRKNKI